MYHLTLLDSVIETVQVQARVAVGGALRNDLLSPGIVGTEVINGFLDNRLKTFVAEQATVSRHALRALRLRPTAHVLRACGMVGCVTSAGLCLQFVVAREAEAEKRKLAEKIRKQQEEKTAREKEKAEKEELKRQEEKKQKMEEEKRLAQEKKKKEEAEAAEKKRQAEKVSMTASLVRRLVPGARALDVSHVFSGSTVVSAYDTLAFHLVSLHAPAYVTAEQD